MSKSVLVLMLVLWTGCGAVRSSQRSEPVDISFRVGTTVQWLSAFRGRPLLLTLIRTSEVTSEMQVIQLMEVYRSAIDNTDFVLLSIDPNDEPMIAYFQEFHGIPVPTGLAGDDVATGNSDLGKIPLVPTSYLLDDTGRVISVFPGVTAASSLMAAIRQVEK